MERLTDAIAHAIRLELMEDLWWLFASEPLDAVVKETIRLVEHDDEWAKGSSDVPGILGRESANFIGLGEMVRDSSNVHGVHGRESANFIELEVVIKVIFDEQGE